ncbi:cyclic nucleotide-binding domain-containing protein [Candidatus Riflebacteria bacterium]
MSKEKNADSLKDLLKNHVVFSTLSAEKLVEFLPLFKKVYYKSGEIISRQGDRDNYLKLIFWGLAQVIFRQVEDGQLITVRKFSKGDFIGIRGIFKNEIRKTTVRALNDIIIYQVHREKILQFVNENPELSPYFEQLIRESEVIEFLSLTSFMGHVPQKKMLGYLEKFETFRAKAGELILKEGTIGEKFFIIKSGEVRAFRIVDKEEEHLAILGPGNYFGQLSLVMDQPRKASIVAISDVECLCLSRFHFKALLQKDPDVKVNILEKIEGYEIREEKKEELLEPDLSEGARKFRDLFELSLEAFQLIDIDSGYLDCNSATLKLFSFSSRDEFCKSSPGLLSPLKQADGRDSISAMRQNLSEALSAGSGNFEWIHRTKNGHDFYADILFTTFEIEGKKVIQATVRDISEKKLAEEKLKKANEEMEARVAMRTIELERAKWLAEKANQAKSILLAHMTHEMQNPLHEILEFCDNSLENPSESDPDPDEIKRAIHTIKDNGQRLLGLIKNLLVLSEQGVGKMVFHLKPGNLVQICEQAMGIVQPLCAEKRIKFDLQKQDFVFDCLMDADKIVQVFTNVFANAIKFSPPDGAIKISFFKDGNKIQVKIFDAGPGIPEAELDSIFESLPHISEAEGQAGISDLGLIICREIIEAHHGEIWAENNREKGACFSFNLPISEPG